jgi:hypothetical protein
MFGSDLMIAPILEANTFKRKVYFPRVPHPPHNNRLPRSTNKTSGCMSGLVRKSTDAPATRW